MGENFLLMVAELPITQPWILSKPLDVTFNTDGMVVQRFPFPATVMDYIFKNLNAHHLLKLYQTCKFFYNKFGFNIIENFNICIHKSQECIIGNSMTISILNPAYPKLQNLWISESFIYHDLGYFQDTFGKKRCLFDIKQYSRMSIKKLDINGVLSLDEFKILVSSPFLTDVKIDDQINVFKDGNDISFTQIFDLIPNVSSFCLYVTYIYPHTMTELLGIERQTKLKKLHFGMIVDPRKFEDEYFEGETLDPKLVAQFIMKNGTPDCDYAFDFLLQYSNDHQKRFDEALEAELALWKLTAHQDKQHRHHHHRKSPSNSISPPSYSVVEGVDGKLVNPTLNVTWPERPNSGRHSINEYLKRRGKTTPLGDQITEETRVSMDTSDATKKSRRHVKEPDEKCQIDEITERLQRIEFVEQQALERKRGDKERKQQREKKKKEKKSRARKRSESVSDNEKIESLVSLDSYEPLPSHEHHDQQRRRRRHHHHRNKSRKESTSSSFSSFTEESNERGSSIIVPTSIQPHFAGVQQETTIRNFLRPTQFVLYYQRANVTTLDELPYSIPLKMAYMSNRNIVHHFSVQVDTRHDGRKFWHVDLGSSNKNQQPYFQSMSALISFYEGFVSLKKNGDVEVFPVSDSD